MRMCYTLESFESTLSARPSYVTLARLIRCRCLKLKEKQIFEPSVIVNKSLMARNNNGGAATVGKCVNSRKIYSLAFGNNFHYRRISAFVLLL